MTPLLCELAAAAGLVPTLGPLDLLGLGDWQGSSQELRAGLFMQELAENGEPLDGAPLLAAAH